MSIERSALRFQLKEDAPGDPANAAFLCEASALAYLKALNKAVSDHPTEKAPPGV